MKTWNELFNNVNESHKKTKENQITWICETIKKLSDEQIKKVYDFIEDELDVE